MVSAQESGGRKVEYVARSLEENLERVLEVEREGWEGAGRGKICVGEEGWEDLESEREYEVEVEGTSELFGTQRVASFLFYLSAPPSRSSSSSSRQITSPSPSPSCSSSSLWDISPYSLYGLITYPSGLTTLPSSLRSIPLTITTKALSSCPTTHPAKDILPPGSFSYSFNPLPLPSSPLVDTDPNDWASGTTITIPPSILEDRDAFPVDEPVGIRVTGNFGDNITFYADMAINFSPAPVKMVLGPQFESILGAEEKLVIDFMGSFTEDGIVFQEDEEGTEGEYEWEWDWRCSIPRGREEEVGRQCECAGGEIVVLPGREEGRFEGTGGTEGWVVGGAYYFVVRVNVRTFGGGEVVARGEWEGVVSVVEEGLGRGLEVREERSLCDDSTVGYTVCFNFFFLF